MYDAVWAAAHAFDHLVRGKGLAPCEYPAYKGRTAKADSDTCFSGVDLYNAFLRVQFEGVTGRVQLQPNGDRLGTGLMYLLYNFQPPEDGGLGRFRPVGQLKIDSTQVPACDGTAGRLCACHLTSPSPPTPGHWAAVAPHRPNDSATSARRLVQAIPPSGRPLLVEAKSTRRSGMGCVLEEQRDSSCTINVDLGGTKVGGGKGHPQKVPQATRANAAHVWCPL